MVQWDGDLDYLVWQLHYRKDDLFDLENMETVRVKQMAM